MLYACLHLSVHFSEGPNDTVVPGMTKKSKCKLGFWDCIPNCLTGKDEPIPGGICGTISLWHNMVVQLLSITLDRKSLLIWGYSLRIQDRTLWEGFKGMEQIHQQGDYQRPGESNDLCWVKMKYPNCHSWPRRKEIKSSGKWIYWSEYNRPENLPEKYFPQEDLENISFHKVNRNVLVTGAFTSWGCPALVPLYR